MTSHNPYVVPSQSANPVVPVTVPNMSKSCGISFSMTPQLIPQPTSQVSPGMVTTGPQTFGGNLTFSGSTVSGHNAQMSGGNANWVPQSGPQSVHNHVSFNGMLPEHSSPIGTPPKSGSKSSGQIYPGFYPGGTPPMSKSSDKFA